MGYVDKVLGADEQVIARGKIHWIVYFAPIVFFFVATFCFISIPTSDPSHQGVWGLIVFVFMILAFFTWLRAFIERWTTEIAVTTRRVIVKTGLIRRNTIEMNADKVESVDVDQSILGRVLNYGTVTVRGTGSGLNPMYRIRQPLELRAAIARI